MCGLSQNKVLILDRLSVSKCRLSAVRTATEMSLYSRRHEEQKPDRLYAL
jgi:copper oxidase (laccase) domain-containing protein